MYQLPKCKYSYLTFVKLQIERETERVCLECFENSLINITDHLRAAAALVEISSR